ncbi:MAG: ABC transporter ATP-binding protein [Saprospiraceae bacterium]|nr:ABC transporter ATP-binding protein [Saprospiraceae bacterium]
MARKIIEAKNIEKTFSDPIPVKVLNNINLTIEQGEFVSIVGKSGSGKSSLMYILSTMDTEYDGELYLDGELMRNKTEQQRAHIRNEKIGFVFQFHYLLNEFTVIENIILPGLKAGKKSEEELRAKAKSLIEIMDIKKVENNKAFQISGGEKQRVAIARSLINDPLIIMADEPTGNLDVKNSDIVFSIFENLSKERNQTLLIVTHDIEFANRTHRIVEMEDGRIL